MKKILITILLLCPPCLISAQWNAGFNTGSNYTLTGDWDFQGGVEMDVVVLDSITINYLNLEGPLVFDSLGAGALSHNAYIDLSAADNNSSSIYWINAGTNDFWKTDGTFKFSKTGYIGYLYFNGTYRYLGLASTGGRIVWDSTNKYMTLDTDDGTLGYTVRIGCIDDGAFTTFDSTGTATHPAGGLKITPGAIPASPVEGQFCITSTGDSMGVYLASGWKWFIAGE